MLQALTAGKGYADGNWFATTTPLIGDVNADGKFTNADLQSLIDLLKTGGGSIAAVPEPAALALGALGCAVLTQMIVWTQRKSGKPWWR